MSFKKIVVSVFISIMFSMAFAQQHITNFGVVDTSKIYEQYFRNSSAIRTYDQKKEEFQAEINRRTEELRGLQQKKTDYENDANEVQLKKVTESIQKKTASLKDYTAAKKLELENIKKSLRDSDEFYKNLSKTIKKVAENEGLSMVLNLQQNNSILWYSPAVDITDKVIAALEM